MFPAAEGTTMGFNIKGSAECRIGISGKDHTLRERLRESDKAHEEIGTEDHGMTSSK